jgi:hypothetical protein
VPPAEGYLRVVRSRLVRLRRIAVRSLRVALGPGRIGQRLRAPRRAPAAISAEALQGQFDPAFYRLMYPDVDRAGSDPLEHFVTYGVAEGRVGWLHMPQAVGRLDRNRPTALVVFDQGSRTATTILGYNLVRQFLRDGNAVTLFLSPGPMMAACRDAGALVLGPEVGMGPFTHGRNLFRRILEEIAPRFAVLNGLEARYVSRALADLYVPTISLIHDFDADKVPTGAVTEAVFWSGETVFTDATVRDNARSSDFALSDLDLPVIPLVRCDVAHDDGGAGPSRGDELAPISAVPQPKSAATLDMDGFVSHVREMVALVSARAAQERRDAEVIADSELIQVGFHRPLEQSHEPYADTVRRYVRAWSRGTHRRKPFPGFHPGIYQEVHGVERQGADPLAEYIRAGRPHGPWNFDLLTPSATSPSVPGNLRVALQIHVHYPDRLAALVERLTQNRATIDLLVSATSDRAAHAARSQLRHYRGGSVEVRQVPNRGRDIAPLLTEFADTILANYDIVGHVHTKKTADVADATLGETWYRFLLENLLGGHARMADETLARMTANPEVGMVFADDPHVVGWTGNRAGAEALSTRLGIDRIPENPVFPVGTMFWARVAALRPLFDFGLTLDDYPEEPAPYDGTILHVIERVLPMVATASGATILLSHVPGVTR